MIEGRQFFCFEFKSALKGLMDHYKENRNVHECANLHFLETEIFE